MNPLARISTFAVTLLALGAGAAAIGNAAGPVATVPAQDHAGQDHSGQGHDGHGATEQPGGSATPGPSGGSVVGAPAGLQASEGGYTLELDRTTFAGGRLDLSFRILDAQGAAVTDFDLAHGKPMHVIVVDHDLQTFRHVHPELAPDGTWSTRLAVPDAGDYRVFADFHATGATGGSTLGHDIAVAGSYRPVPLPSPADTAVVGDYEVRLEGRLAPGGTAPVEVHVEKDGRPVRDLEPYLEAYGHLVALRAGDLAYLHVHPDGVPGDGTTQPGPDVAFGVEVPSGGTYRLFLDFKHDGRVRTAAFTTSTSAPLAATSGEAGPPADAHTH